MAKPLSPFELEIMQLVWNLEPVTVRNLVDEVNRKRTSKIVRTSVLKQVQRLEQQEYLIRNDSRPAQFRSTVSESEVSSRAASDLVRTFFGGSHMNLVRQMIDDQPLSDEEIEEITDLIKNANKE